jgi:hypothetical protein
MDAKDGVNACIASGVFPGWRREFNAEADFDPRVATIL